MTRLESNIVQIAHPAKEVYTFLSNLNNHRRIMPSQVVNWESDHDTCHYTITGTGTVYLRVKERTEYRKIVLEPNGKIPFPFEVEWLVEVLDETNCRVQAIMNAELNAMLKMMASRPLTNFLNNQVDGLKQLNIFS